MKRRFWTLRQVLQKPLLKKRWKARRKNFISLPLDWTLKSLMVDLQIRVRSLIKVIIMLPSVIPRTQEETRSTAKKRMITQVCSQGCQTMIDQRMCLRHIGRPLMRDIMEYVFKLFFCVETSHRRDLMFNHSHLRMNLKKSIVISQRG
jgi:hypothetical protein